MKTNGIFCELDLEMKVRNCFIIVYIRCDYNVFFPHRTVSSARIRNSGLKSLLISSLCVGMARLAKPVRCVSVRTISSRSTSLCTAITS